MTFDEYINNPMGQKSAVISNREMYRKMYTDKFNKVMVREVGKIDYHLYKGKSKYYCYLRVPSEVVPNFYYDVVIEFSEPKGMKKITDASLTKYDVKFFSNDPSFNYTFAHAFKKNKLTIKDLESKMSKEALMKPAREKNPQDTIGYVKTLYFAYIVMNEKGLFVPSLYHNNGKKYNKKFLLQKISNTEDKLQERSEASKKDKNPNDTGDSIIDDLLDSEVDKATHKGPNKIKNMNFIGKINNISNNSKINKINGIKNTRKIKSSKKIGGLK